MYRIDAVREHSTAVLIISEMVTALEKCRENSYELRHRIAFAQCSLLCVIHPYCPYHVIPIFSHSVLHSPIRPAEQMRSCALHEQILLNSLCTYFISSLSECQFTQQQHFYDERKQRRWTKKKEKNMIIMDLLSLWAYTSCKQILTHQKVSI